MPDLSGLVRNVVFPIWARRDHPHYQKYLQEFERTQFLSQADLADLQLRRLKEIVRHAYANCEFYRQRLDHVGLAGGDLRSLSDLKRIPILTKKDIQQNAERMLAVNVPERDRQRNQTGGSTGSPLQFWVDTERLDSRMASTVRHNRWAGYENGDWCAYLWGARMDLQTSDSLWNTLRNHLLYRRLELNTSSVAPAEWDRFIERVQRYCPPVLLAYARSAVQLALEAEHRGIKLGFRSIITTAEVLTAEHRDLLEQAFTGKVFNRYGCREVSVIASECERHTGLHVNADALLLEIESDPALPKGHGKIIVTDLFNRSLPLIRYEIGDAGRWAEQQKCPCGRGLPLLADLEGRTTDFLVLADGRVVSGPALTLIVADMKDVGQVQFIQTSPTHVELRVVPGNGFGSHTRAELQKRLDLYLQGSARLDVVEVAEIEKEASGKYRFVINRTKGNTAAAKN